MYFKDFLKINIYIKNKVYDNIWCIKNIGIIDIYLNIFLD